MNEIIKFLLAMVGLFVVDMIDKYIIAKKYAKKANYDCSKCKVWDCPIQLCGKLDKK